MKLAICEKDRKIMRILFTICGRAGSKGVKNKNIKDFLGKPLAYYTVSAIDLFLKKTDMDLTVDAVVNSDSPELLKLLSENPKMKIECIERKPELGGDTVGKIDVINNCLDIMQKRHNVQYDIVVDLDITSPLRTAKDIDNVIKTHIEKKPDVTTTVAPARRNPYFNQLKKTEKGFKKVIESNYTARQQAPELFDMNASIYAYSPAFLAENKGVLSGYCECVVMEDTGILDIDHENDFKLMEVIGKYFFEAKEEFKQIYNNI